MLVKYDPGTIKHEISDNSSIYRKGHLSFLVEARSWKADVGLWLASSSWNYNRAHFSFPLKLRVALQQEMRWELHSWLGFRSHAACQARQILGQDLEAAAVKGTLKGKGWIGRLIQAWGSSCPKVDNNWVYCFIYKWSLSLGCLVVEFYISEQGGAVKSVGVRQASGDPAARASSWRHTPCSAFLPGQ